MGIREPATTDSGHPSGEMHDGGTTPPVLFLVDDDLPTLELLREIAESAGWQTLAFSRLEPLRHALGQDRPTLLIVDDELPDGRGGDLVRDLRTDPAFEDVPLIVCTAAPERRQAEIGRWAPVVSKPFDLDEIERHLSAATGSHLHRSRGSDGRAYDRAAG